MQTSIGWWAAMLSRQPRVPALESLLRPTPAADMLEQAAREHAAIVEHAEQMRQQHAASADDADSS